MNSETYDLIVVGAGPAGYVAAIRAAQLGMKTACVESRKSMGGTCLNVGCIPSKALLDSSEHFAHAGAKLKKHGVEVSGVKLNLGAMMKRKDAVVRQLTNGIMGLFKKNKVTPVIGTGKLLKPEGGLNRVEVDGGTAKQVLSGKNILIATGSAPVELPFLKFDGKSVISSTEALSLESVPGHLVVIGGGVIGLELGSVWLRLGAKVTVVEFMDRLVPGMDAELGRELMKALKKQGMEFMLSSKCLGAKHSGKKTSVEVEDTKSGKKISLDADKVLVATGRKPYTEGLGLGDAGVKTDEKGRVVIDDAFKTSVPGIWAVGDVVRGPMLAHKAEEEGIAAVEIMSGQKPHVNYGAIPGVVYTWPEFAAVGMTEEEAKATGKDYRTGKFPFMANGRAKAMDETDGMVKIVSDAATDRVLGVHIVGPRASDMIAEAVAVIEFGGSSEDIARTSHGHPTLSEVMKEAALAVDKRAIHM